MQIYANFGKRCWCFHLLLLISYLYIFILYYLLLFVIFWTGFRWKWWNIQHCYENANIIITSNGIIDATVCKNCKNWARPGWCWGCWGMFPRPNWNENPTRDNGPAMQPPQPHQHHNTTHSLSRSNRFISNQTTFSTNMKQELGCINCCLNFNFNFNGIIQHVGSTLPFFIVDSNLKYQLSSQNYEIEFT